MNIKSAHPEVYKALEKTGLPWEIKSGRRHWRIVLSGRQVGVLSYGKQSKQSRDESGKKNLIAQIRRAARDV
jgi:hypothetical protein